MTDEVPSGLEIAHVVRDRIRDLGWQKAWWSTADGMDICSRYTRNAEGLHVEAPGTYVFITGYQDLDFDQAFLLAVCTQSDETTWVDYLSVYIGGASRQTLDVQWAQKRHLFHERSDQRNEALHWWVDLVDEIRAPLTDGG
jgi:hypothetical protein